MTSIPAAVAYFSDSKVDGALSHIQRGIEKESLRIDVGGKLALTPHSQALGSALTNPFITTDFSEALLEFITPPSNSLDETLSCLHNIHHYVYQNIGEESLWATSMPCIMGRDNAIPVAQYGSSNAAKMKTIYRIGLGHRYGRTMQTIAGVHYNFSLQESFWRSYQAYRQDSQDLKSFITEQYFGLIRNFRRFGWLITYLFGASPALCETFLSAANVNKLNLKKMGRGTHYLPFGTSLRMSDIGYSNNAQSKLNISYNSLDKYLKGLNKAIASPEPLYEEIGVKVDGEYRQLSANLLQIENEYYSSIRPKQIAKSGERPSTALRERGVEYIEVRSLDINPFSPTGISEEQCTFLDCFLLYCLFADSPPLSIREQAEADENQSRIVELGRQPGLSLRRNNRDVDFVEFASEIVDGLTPIALSLDNDYKSSRYASMLEQVKAMLLDTEQTLSGRVMAALQKPADDHYSEESFFQFAMQCSQAHRQYFMDSPLAENVAKRFSETAVTSLEKQAAIEASDKLSFEEFLAAYYRH